VNPLARVCPFVILALALTGCAVGGTDPVPARSAYDKACRSIYMTKAAAREARWCWQAAGVRSYEEWAAIERPELPDRPTAAARAVTSGR
jgi:hypothetical protein